MDGFSLEIGFAHFHRYFGIPVGGGRHGEGDFHKGIYGDIRPIGFPAVDLACQGVDSFLPEGDKTACVRQRSGKGVCKGHFLTILLNAPCDAALYTAQHFHIHHGIRVSGLGQAKAEFPHRQDLNVLGYGDGFPSAALCRGGEGIGTRGVKGNAAAVGV